MFHCLFVELEAVVADYEACVYFSVCFQELVYMSVLDEIGSYLVSNYSVNYDNIKIAST